MQTPTQIKAALTSHSGEEGIGSIIEILSTMREHPAASRNRRRPTPGLPLGKVEYRRCKKSPLPYRI
jgi:hypothetical protein